MAVGGYGAKVKIYSSGVLTAIADVLDHTIPEEIKHLADSTARPTSGQTGYSTHLDTGKRRLGEFSITVSWDAGETTHAALLTAYASTDPVVFLLENADGSDTLWITALVRSIGRIAQQEDGYKCTVNLMPTGDVSYTGAEARIFDFTLAASDSFDRSNGALGNTDGAGIDGVTGGSGLAWTEQIGTWAIASNTARAATVVSNLAVATVDTGLKDCVIVGKVTTAGSTGLIARFVDSNNYLRAYITSANQLFLAKVVGGSATTLIQKAPTYVAGAEIVLHLYGDYVGLEYNGVYYGAAAIPSDLADATAHGMMTNVAGSTLYLSEWHCVNLGGSFENAMQPSIVQAMPGEYLCSVPVRNETARVAEFYLRQEKTILSGYSAASEVRRISALSLRSISNGARTSVAHKDAGWEQAGQIGADADAEGDYDYYGSVHQSETLDTFAITVEGYSGTLPRWKRVYSRSIRIDQTMTTIYPKDKTTEIGNTTMRHTFYGDKLRVTRSHTHEAGYKIYGWYGAMLPVDSPNVNRWSIGGSNGVAFAGDDAGKGYMDASKAIAYLNTGDFTVVMELPTGSADDSGAWTYTGTEYMWFKDNASAPQKFYATYVSNTFANKITAGASSHTVDYYVQNGIP